MRSWKVTKYMIFDTPDRDQLTLEDRYLKIHLICQRIRLQWLHKNPEGFQSHTDLMLPDECPINEVFQIKISRGVDEVEEHYQRIISGGGEGIILREPGSWYTNQRSSSFLKYKKYHECEAVIFDYKPGNGRNQGRLGSFGVHPINSEGYPNRRVIFHVSGVNDHIRINYRETHPIGTVITMIFTEYTKDLRPRHPRFKGTRGFLDLNDPQAKWTPDFLVDAEGVFFPQATPLKLRLRKSISAPTPHVSISPPVSTTPSTPIPAPTPAPTSAPAVLNITLKSRCPATAVIDVIVPIQIKSKNRI